MAEVTRRRSGELVRGVFRVLLDHADGLPAKRVLAEIEHLVPPTDFEQTEYPNRPGVRRYEKTIRFMTINAVKAGWLVKDRGQWTLTDEGRLAFDKFTDPEDLMRESVRLYRAWRAEQPEPTTIPPNYETEDEDSVDAGVASTIEEADEEAWDGIRSYVRTMAAYPFQDFVAALLDGMGYHVAWVAPPGPDQGLDVLAYRDPLGADGPRIKVQVKQRPLTKVTVDEIRSFMSLLGGQDVGIYVSTGGFTSEAHKLARAQESRRITLIDLDLVIQLWIDHYDALPEPSRLLLPLRPVWFIAPT